MSLRVSYIGEPLTAAGFALAGARVHVTGSDDAALYELFESSRGDCDILFINQRHADALGARLDDVLRHAPLPPVLVVPSMERDEVAQRDVLAAARRALGLGTG